MKLISIKDIVKAKGDIPLYYRNEYDAIAHFEKRDGSQTLVPVYFLVETLPTGDKSIEIKIKESVDYPLLPLLKSLKQEIIFLDRRGALL